MAQRREPIVAGSFYPGQEAALVEMLDDLLGEGDLNETPLPGPIGLIAPHAGYVYSGGVAAAGYREVGRVGRPEWAIVLGANHTGYGRPVSLAQGGTWRTPLGDAPIATEVADRLVACGAEVSEVAFAREHSVEVQLPFLQVLFGAEIPFVPIAVMAPPLERLVALGDCFAETARGRAGLIVASSDFTHYEPDGVAREADRRALERILALDVDGFWQLLTRERLSICGGGAIALLMTVARALGLEPRLVSYATSGDVSGDRSAVVGYAAVLFQGGGDA